LGKALDSATGGKKLPAKGLIAGAVGLLAVAGLGIGALAYIPSLFDSEGHLQKVAKRVAQGPKDPEEATRMKNDLESAFQDYLNKNRNLTGNELIAKLQRVFPSSAYEVHAFDLPNGSKLIELDTLLQGSSFIVTSKRAALLKDFDVYDNGRTFDNAGVAVEGKNAAYMILLGHKSAQTGRKPQIKVLSLQGDDFNDVSSRAVPTFTGDGTASFIGNGVNVAMEISIASKAVAEKLYSLPGITGSGVNDEMIKAKLTFRDGQYQFTEAVGKDKLACLRAVAFALTDPSQKSRFSRYISAVSGQFPDNKPMVKRIPPLFFISPMSGSSISKQITREKPDDGRRRRRRHPKTETVTVSQAANRYKISNDDDAFAVTLVREGGVVTCANFKRLPLAVDNNPRDGALVKGYENQTSTLVDKFLNFADTTGGGKKGDADSAATSRQTNSINAGTANDGSKIVLVTDGNGKKSSQVAGEAVNMAKKTAERATETASSAATAGSQKIVERKAPVEAGTIAGSLSSPTVKVRRGPGTNYRSLAEVPKGSHLEIVGKQNGWYKVKVAGKEGFVYGGFVNCPTSDAYTTATVKAASSIIDEHNRVMGQADAGDRFVVVGGQNSDKYKVQLSNGRTGYVSKNSLDVGGETPPPFVP
jgi:hypothetical protein